MRWCKKKPGGIVSHPKPASACVDCGAKGCDFRNPFVVSCGPKETWRKAHPPGVAHGGLITKPSILGMGSYHPCVATNRELDALCKDLKDAIRKPKSLIGAYDAFFAEARGIFIERQKEHKQGSINDVGLDDLMGVARLKVARAKHQVLAGVPIKKVFKDSLLDLANYCFILWAKHTDEWNLEWKDAA